MRDHHLTRGELIDGRYELAELLGRGGMGEVWAAYDQRLDRSVAVKLLTPRTAVSEMPRGLDPQDPAVVRFTREARLMAKLEHPYVPVIHDAGTHRASRLYLVMQRVYGHTLDRLVAQRGSLSGGVGRRGGRPGVLRAGPGSRAAWPPTGDRRPAT